MALKADVLWYWIGGSQRGEWRAVACASSEFEAKEAALHRAGYITRRGLRSIGAPEGAPRELGRD